MASEIFIRKQALRQELRTRYKLLPATDRANASSLLCSRIKELEFWHKAQSVLFYVPLPDEPDIRSLMAEVLNAGKVITLPRFMKEEGQYAAARIGDYDKDVKPGKFDIIEPRTRCALYPLNQLDLVLVPGVAFDVNGYRLGRGKGFYDRLLAQVKGVKCGIAFDWQVAPQIPAEPHDVRLNCVLTPTRWLEIATTAQR